MTFDIGESQITIDNLAGFLSGETKLSLGDLAKTKIERCRLYLEHKLATSPIPIYGVNTGFGSLCDVAVSQENIEQLQLNLIRSHACGVGAPISDEMVRLIIVLKVNSLAQGYSGVRTDLVTALISLYNADVLPVIYEYGSLGASGDLAPLAHLSLTLVGEGDVRQVDTIQHSAIALKEHTITPIKLKAKEGLALLNGTQFSTAFAAHSCYHGLKLLNVFNAIAAISTIAFKGNTSAFDPKVHKIRKQKGQIICAEEIKKILDQNHYLNEDHVVIQDPYSIRCTPQVHGASLDALTFARQVIENEMNAVTDNPNIFIDADEVISGGNFHAQPIALVLDQMNIALSELGNISERRTYQLLSGARGLPDFLIDNPGLHSGLMITQYTAASLVNQNKTWCMPNSVDSIVSSNGQEDHVSMAANAGTKSYRIIENLYHIAAIELLCSMQALEYRKDVEIHGQIQEWYHEYRTTISKITVDRNLSKDIQKSLEFIQKWPSIKN